MEKYLVAKLIVTALLCCATIGRANPLSGSDVIERPPDPFDGGEINSCVNVTLSEEDASVCRITYEVPSYVEAIATILISEVRGALANKDRVAEMCLATLTEVLCTQKFPRCQKRESGDVLVEQVYTQNCDQRLRANCNDKDYNRIKRDNSFVCGFPNLTTDSTQVPDTPCMPVSSYGYNLQICHTVINVDNTMMTPWMFEHLKQKDALAHFQLQDLTSRSLLTVDPTCTQRWAAYFCQYVGRCNRDGTRVEVVNTLEQCEELKTW